jgi:hypothetical protein
MQADPGRAVDRAGVRHGRQHGGEWQKAGVIEKDYQGKPDSGKSLLVTVCSDDKADG